MTSRARREFIVGAVANGGLATVSELASQLEVSESTIRRDLRELDRNGELRRTYGGAVPWPVGHSVPAAGGRSDERPFAQALAADVGSRQAIAARAADLVPDDSVILLDIGTTTPLIARRLVGRPVTVITNNLGVLDELRGDDTVRLVLLGGVLRRNYQTLVGSLAQTALRDISADLLFLSCTGVRPNGHVVDDMAVEAPIKQAMIAAASRVVLLASHSKFPGTGVLRVHDLARVDVLVTTAEAPAETTQLCADAGGEVLIA